MVQVSALTSHAAPPLRAGAVARIGAAAATGIVVAGPIALALTLPGPGEALARLGRASAISTLIDDAMLACAVFATWAFLTWLAVAAGVALLRLLPGWVGRAATASLRAITPAALRRLVVVATGIGLVGGLSACGEPFGGGSAPVAVAASVSAAGSVAEEPAMTAELALDLDWLSAATGSGDAPAAPDPVMRDAPAALTEPADPGAPPTQIDLVGDRIVITAASPHLAPDPLFVPPGSLSAAEDSTGAAAPGAAATVAAADAGASAPDRVRVAAGDSLWTIAARHLPEGADAAAVDAAWRSWYAQNRDVIGDDPNLIIPGMMLAVPDGVTR